LLGLHLGVVAGQYLCGDWQQLSLAKCGLVIECCTVASTNPDGTVVCQSPLAVDKTTSIISQDNYQYAGNGQYQETLLIATGNSCPLDYSTGTVLFAVDTYGTYTDLGPNTDVNQGWHKVMYQPTKVVATVTKTNQAAPYTPGMLTTPSGNQVAQLVSPCMVMTDYLNNVNVGCPCNETGSWTSAGGIASGATMTSASRNISSTYAAHCPMVNNTNGTMVSSCPENNFFNFSPKYGNARVTNTSSTMRLLEITQPVLDQSTGYNDTNAYANFTANMTCPSTTTGNKGGGSSPAGRVTLLPYFFAVWLIGGFALVVH